MSVGKFPKSVHRQAAIGKHARGAQIGAIWQETGVQQPEVARGPRVSPYQVMTLASLQVCLWSAKLVTFVQEKGRASRERHGQGYVQVRVSPGRAGNPGRAPRIGPLGRKQRSSTQSSKTTRYLQVGIHSLDLWQAWRRSANQEHLVGINHLAGKIFDEHARL